MFIMARPKKIRFIACTPESTYFKPRAIPLSELEEVILRLEEIEALKLKFLEKLEQKEAAKKMKISRTTFWRVFNSAGKKVSDALINGKAIRIEGGHYALEKEVE